MRATLFRLRGVTAHFRDPRINTSKIGLPSRTLHAPPPCTIHGLLCCAAGRWVDTEELRIGWRIDYSSIAIDFARNQLPKRKMYNHRTGLQKTEPSPVEREILAFPILSLLALDDCVLPNWFCRPANPLSLGRSEDLIVEHEWEYVDVVLGTEGQVFRQCLPVNIAAGNIYAAPLYFEAARKPVGMSPRTDAVRTQYVHSKSAELAHVASTGETFYIWDFKDASR